MEHVKATILLVEDQPTVRSILAAGLKAHGFGVLLTGTAEKALALCKGFDGPIDLLLTDIGLTTPSCWAAESQTGAIVHGLALAREAVKVRPSLKVIVLTGHSDETLKRIGGEAAMEFPLLRKPCDLSTLVQTVRQLLSRTSMEPHALGKGEGHVHTTS